MGYIYIVEDDESIRTVLARFLELEGYRTRSAANGKEALERLLVAKERPGMILLDLNMPEMNGWEFLNAMRLNPELSNIPVVVITANQLEKVRHIAADAVLGKPLELDVLLKLCLQWCGGPAQLQAPSFGY